MTGDDGDGTGSEGDESGLDAITLEITRNRLEGIAEEMGQVLITSAYSPNIKERQDCSTALFDAQGHLIAQAEHIPVHLGAMPQAVEAVLERDPQPGDVFVLNDPFAGGTHLPDVTMVSPITLEPVDVGNESGEERRDSSEESTEHEPSSTGNGGENADSEEGQEIVGYAVSRAHHADVGGSVPGSMPADSTAIYAEGLRLPPVRLVAGGERVADVLDLVLANVRNARERRADVSAQLAANDRGAKRLRGLVAQRGREQVLQAFDAVVEYSRDRMETELDALPDGVYEASDVLEGDGRTDAEIPIRTTIEIDGPEIHVDFGGTASQVAGNVNAPLAVATSAVYFAVRCVTDPEIPPNAGCYEPISVSAPQGSLLDPEPPAAVVGGNVETSQRVTDVVLAALGEAVPERVPAGSQGTMNNLIIGGRSGGDGTGETSEGSDENGSDGSDEQGEEFAYYETIGGGFGARPDSDGMDGVQVGMTNTLNTPIEALEAAYPLRVERYTLRPDSGGDGRFRGGLGIERTVRVEVPATASLLTERRAVAPKGIAGGADGTVGENLIDGEPVGAKVTVEVESGTVIVVRTPGGGGHGDPGDRDPEARDRDRADGKVTNRSSEESAREDERDRTEERE